MTQPNLETITLEKGAHKTRKAGVCAMELVAWMAGEKHTDHPACVSPVLSAFLRRWNDNIGDARRQLLKPYLSRVIGTADDGHDERRGWMLTDWMVRTYLPAWMELAGIAEPSATLRGLPEITDKRSLALCSTPLNDARTNAAAARAAARAAAGAAARDAARDAVWAAAGDAARDAARDAAWDAARDAVWAAAGDAARDAARDAAWDAARAAVWAAARAAAEAAAWAAAGDAATKELEPTVLSLQESAFALLDRLIDPSAGMGAE